MSTDRQSVKDTLSGADFPASKEQLLTYVEKHSADESVVHALHTVPSVEYANVGEILQSVPLSKGAEEGQSDSDKAQEQRYNNNSGLAEHHTEIPSNPIVDELGENRGS